MHADLPNIRLHMLRAGYKFLSRTHCRRCQRTIEWWKTTHGKKVAFQPMHSDSDRSEVHSASCPAADPAAPKQTKSLDQLARDLREQTNARLVIIVADERSAASWRTDAKGEDLRSDCIEMGNKLRNYLKGGN